MDRTLRWKLIVPETRGVARIRHRVDIVDGKIVVPCRGTAVHDSGGRARARDGRTGGRKRTQNALMSKMRRLRELLC